MNNTVDNRREIKIGLLGYGFMGKVHTHAYKTIQHKYSDNDFNPKLFAIAGLGEKETEAAARQYTFEKWSTDWTEVVNNPDVDVIDICLTEDMHEEVCLAAIRARKHVFCEKPLALSATGCKRIVETANDKNIKTMCGFNYRFLPAIRLAKELIDDDMLGEIYYINAQYTQDSGHDPNRPLDEIRYLNGKQPLGTIRGLGSHLIDTVRYLCGDIISLSANVRTAIPERPLTNGRRALVKTDDIAILSIETESCIGTLTASAISTGRKNRLAFEINGSKGSIYFDLENLNILSVYLNDYKDKKIKGFTQINVTDKVHPLMKDWLPPIHNIGWETGHINELNYFLNCIANDKDVEPVGAGFVDGYKAALIAEYAVRASKQGRRIKITV